MNDEHHNKDLDVGARVLEVMENGEEIGYEEEEKIDIPRPEKGREAASHETLLVKQVARDLEKVERILLQLKGLTNEEMESVPGNPLIALQQVVGHFEEIIPELSKRLKEVV